MLVTLVSLKGYMLKQISKFMFLSCNKISNKPNHCDFKMATSQDYKHSRYSGIYMLSPFPLSPVPLQAADAHLYDTNEHTSTAYGTVTGLVWITSSPTLNCGLPAFSICATVAGA